MAGIDKNLLKLRFARGTGSYTAAASVQAEMADRLLTGIAATGRRVFPRVLELGPGDGTLTGRLQTALTIERLTLLELVPEWEMFHLGRGGAEFLVGDAETFDFSGRGFDLIAANAVFQWFVEPERTLARLRAALVPGGLVAFSAFSPGNLEEISVLTGRGLPERSLAEYAELTGRYFRVVGTGEYCRRLRFNEPLAALKHLKRTGVTGVAPAGRWSRGGLRELCAEYLRRFGLPDGSVTLTYRPLLVVAVRED